jgi:hypothetical protein
MLSYKKKDPIILIALTAHHTMHQPYHVVTLHESTKKFVILRVRIFTESKPNFMVTPCVLGNILQRSYLSPTHSKGNSQSVGLVYKISNPMQTDT